MDDETHLYPRPRDLVHTLALIDQLQSDRRTRNRHQLFFVEGVRNFVTALDFGFTVETLLYSERLLTSPLARKLVRRLKRAGIPFVRVSPEQFRQVSQAEQASGVAAILRQHTQQLADVIPQHDHCWVALSHIRSPGNLGTLVRTAAATGATGFILLDEQVDPFDPAVVRASMGTLFRQAVVRASPEELRSWVHHYTVQVIGASPDGTISYDQAHYQYPTVLMLGEERSGLSPDQRGLCQHIVHIPMVETVDSLNLAVAGSLLLYEAFRTVRRKAPHD